MELWFNGEESGLAGQPAKHDSHGGLDKQLELVQVMGDFDRKVPLS
jgi:hypothetical protein